MSDPVYFWNTVALETHRRDFTVGGGGNSRDRADLNPEQNGPTATSRALAIVHIAIYNAVALTSGGLTPYTGAVAGSMALPVWGGAVPAPMPETATAVCAAAMATLSELWPRQARFIDMRGEAFMAESGAGASVAAAQFGRAVARAILDFRGKDLSLPGTRLAGGGQPMLHRVDPFAPDQSYLGVGWGQVPKFTIDPAGYRLDDYILKPPMGPDYDAAVTEVLHLGRDVGSTRSPEQTTIGIFWGYDGPRGLGVPPRLYNQIVRSYLDRLPTLPSTRDLARLFALVNTGMADAAIVAWDAKYEFNLWRPVLGVREHDMGFGPGHGAGKGLTIGDPQWAPLGAPQTNLPGVFNRTPPFPAYPSGHATFGAVVFRVLAQFIAQRGDGDVDLAMQTSVEASSEEYDGTNLDPRGDLRPVHKRQLTLNEMIVENAVSRVYLGVHYRFDGLAEKKASPDEIKLDTAAELKAKVGGTAVGLKIADDMFANYFH